MERPPKKADKNAMTRPKLMLTLPLALVAFAGTPVAQETLRRGASNEQLIDDELRQAVSRGHEWLAAHQHRDGYWAELVGYKLNTSYEALDERPLPHVGVTSLALMSFLAGGHLPDRGKHAQATPLVEKRTTETARLFEYHHFAARRQPATQHVGRVGEVSGKPLNQLDFPRPSDHPARDTQRVRFHASRSSFARART